MKKTNKGFTIVELVVVIAVVAVLAAVLIPTFTSIIKKANDSAYLQERQSKQIEDLAEKIDNQNYLTWGDFEKELAEAMAKATETDKEALSAEIKTAVEAALEKYDDKGITEEQVKKIIEKSLEGVLSREQVEGIVNAAVAKAGTSASSITPAQVQAIVNASIAQLPTSTGITASQMNTAITSAINSLMTSEKLSAAIGNAVSEQLAAALAKFEAAQLTEEDIEEIVKAATATYVAIVDGETTYYYDSLPEVVAGKTMTVKMLRRTSQPFHAVFSSIYTLDANGCEVIFYGDSLGIIGNSVVTLKDSKGTGKFIGHYILQIGSCTLNIESGNFNLDNVGNGGNAPITGLGNTKTYISGGTFNFRPSNGWLVDGYTVSNNGDGTYTVVKASN